MKSRNNNTIVVVLILLFISLGLISIITLFTIENWQNNFQSLSKKSNTIRSSLYAIICLIAASALFFLLIHKKRKQQQKEHLQLLKTMHNIVNQSKDAIIATDFQLNIISWNKGAERMYGYSEQDVLGKQILDTIHTEVSEIKKKQVWKQLKSEDYWKDIVTQYNKEKQAIHVLISISVTRNENNKITGFTGICTDITLQIKAEERIEQLALMVESSNDAIITFNEHLEITSWNKGAERLYGYTATESEGKVLPEFLAMQPTSKFLEAALQNITTTGYWKSEDIHFTKQGTRINVFVSFSPYTASNETRIYVGIITDITEQKEIEKKLVDFNRKLEEMVEEKTAEMRDMFDRVDWGFVALNKNNEYIFINPKASEILHKTKVEVLNRNMWQIFSASEESFYNAYDKAIKTQETVYHENFDTTLNICLATYIFPSETGVSIYFRDITEKKKMQQEVLNINKQLRQLTAHQEKIREEERKKLAGELHDEFGQLITSIKLDADWLNKRINEDQYEIKQKVKDIISLSVDTAKKIRTLAQSLRPSILDDMGLIAAIEWQFAEFEKRTGIVCHFNHEGDNFLLPEEISIQCFRILQECLTNIMRHANAREVICSMTTKEDKFLFKIKDNGQGFNVEEKKNTFGLLGIRERVKVMSGTFNIISHPGNGTNSTFEIPLK